MKKRKAMEYYATAKTYISKYKKVFMPTGKFKEPPSNHTKIAQITEGR